MRKALSALVVIGALVLTTSPAEAKKKPKPHPKATTTTVPPTDVVTQTITVGNKPVAIALSPDGSQLYVANGDGTVSVIDTRTGSVSRTIAVGVGTRGVVVSPDGSRVYVSGDNDVSVIDTHAGVVSGTFDLGPNTNVKPGVTPLKQEPWGLAVSPDGSHLYVCEFFADWVTVIDTRSGSVTANIPVGAYPEKAAVSPDGSRVYVLNGGNFDSDPADQRGTVSIIDTTSNSVVGTIALRLGPEGLAVAPDGSRLYVTDGGTLLVIDTHSGSVTQTITGLRGSTGIAVSPDGTRIYSTLATLVGLWVIDARTGSVSQTVTVGVSPVALVVSRDGSLVYVVDQGTTMAPDGTPTGPGTVSVLRRATR